MLRRHGLAGPDRSLGAALDAIAFAGLFRQGAVLVGTAAYMLFDPLVGSRLPAPTLMTGDLDLATVRLALTAEPPESMTAILRRVDPSYEGIPQLDPRQPLSRFRNAEGYLVDLLTPTQRRTDTNPMPVKELAAGAAPLQYLNWLIADPVPTVALWGAGIAVTVPQPARFAIHQLIIAQRRDRANRPKDLHQAKALIGAMLRDDRFALKDALADACGRGRAGWAELIERSLQDVEYDELLEMRRSG